MSTANELLSDALAAIDDWVYPALRGEIQDYLAAQKAKTEKQPLTDEEIDDEIPDRPGTYDFGFYDGVRFAEKHHGIGERDEQNN